ncbi:MAG TPA: NUDIX domain-containing protein [Phycisphaerales bacterium]|nr:NUDIX domain-containing protein [Phycisphaerales bacterium]
MGKHVEVIARGVIIEARHVLLCQHAKRKYFYLPGGHVEWGETVVEALARELDEEAGVAVHVGPLLVVEDHHFTQNGKRRHEINIIHLAHIAGRCARKPRPVRSREKGLKFVWCPLKKLGKTQLLPPSHIPIVRERARLPLDFLAVADCYDIEREGQSELARAGISWTIPTRSAQ